MRIRSGILVLAIALAAAHGAAAQDRSEPLPSLVQRTEVIYPPLARQARIQGDVLVRITTDGESVSDARAESGNPLLLKVVEDNVRAWKFAPHTAGSFHVTFRFRILSGSAEVNCLQSPFVVEVVAPQLETIIDYGWIGLGTWKAQLTSAHGKSQRRFTLAYSGPHGDWLAGSALGPEGEKEELNFGHREGDFLAFAITLAYPDGQSRKTFFVGKMIGSKIVGTFVDDTGIRGEWSAVRTVERSDSK